MTASLILTAVVPVLGWALVVHVLVWALAIFIAAFLGYLGKLCAEDFHRWLLRRWGSS
jgi:hypothetical protein